GLGAGMAAQRPIQVARGQFGDQASGLGSRPGRERRRQRRQLADLILHGRDQLWVLMADIEIDQLRGEIKIAVAVIIPEPNALACRDRQWIDMRLRRAGVKDVRGITLLDPSALLRIWMKAVHARSPAVK